MLAADYGGAHDARPRCPGGGWRGSCARRSRGRAAGAATRQVAGAEPGVAGWRKSGGAAPRRARSRERLVGFEAEAARLDERDRRLPLLGADLRSPNDELAERAVEAGGGIEAVIEATGLRTRENVLRAIDPAILVRAFDNAANAPAPPDRARLRRLVPDPELVRRRAREKPATVAATTASPTRPWAAGRAAGGCQTLRSCGVAYRLPREELASKRSAARQGR